MLEHPGHYILRKLLKPEFNKDTVDYSNIGRAVLSALIDIATKKIPSDLSYTNKQLDAINQKIKFSPLPKGVFDEPVYQDGALTQEKNTTEKAIVRLRVPKRRIEEEFVEVDDQSGAETVRKTERMVEIDYEDKVLLFPAQVSSRDFSILAFNQVAPRAHRREFYNSLKRAFADHFDSRDAQKDYETFTRRTEEMHELIEKRFIDQHYNEDTMPLLDFEINLNEAE